MPGIESATLAEGCNVFWQKPDGNAQLFTPSATDVEANPLFCDPAKNDFHVGVGSVTEAWSGDSRFDVTVPLRAIVDQGMSADDRAFLGSAAGAVAGAAPGVGANPRCGGP